MARDIADRMSQAGYTVGLTEHSELWLQFGKANAKVKATIAEAEIAGLDAYAQGYAEMIADPSFKKSIGMANAITRQLDDNVHPELRLEVFRLQNGYDARNGYATKGSVHNSK